MPEDKQDDEKTRRGKPNPTSDAGAHVKRMNANPETADLNVVLDEPTQALIGHCLKAVYAEIVEQPVPERLLRLLEELERKEQE